MAVIQCTYTWADGSTLTVTARGKARYPDYLGDLRAEAKRMWCDALAELECEVDTEPVSLPSLDD